MCTITVFWFVFFAKHFTDLRSRHNMELNPWLSVHSVLIPKITATTVVKIQKVPVKNNCVIVWHQKLQAN